MAGKANQPTPKYKLTLSIPHEFARRFDAYCGFIGEDLSDVAVRALKREMRGFSVSRRIDGDVETENPADGTVRIARHGDSREAV